MPRRGFQKRGLDVSAAETTAGGLLKSTWRKSAYGPVAQGIEQQPSKLKVAGSNPAGVANKIDSAGPPRGPSRRPAQDRRPFHRQ